MLSFIKNKFFLIVAALFFLFLPLLSARADFTLIGNEDCLQKGNCTPCDMINVFIQLGVEILGFIGGLTLLFFILGGFYMLVSRGDTGKLEKAKKIMVNSVIGFLIVIFSYSIVAVIVYLLAEGGATLIPPKLTCAGGGGTGDGKKTCTGEHSGYSCQVLGHDLYNLCAAKTTRGKTPSFCKTGLCPKDDDMCCEKKPTTAECMK
jgi:hypothetical protein